MATNNTRIPARTLGASCHRKTRLTGSSSSSPAARPLGYMNVPKTRSLITLLRKARLAHHLRRQVRFAFQTHLPGRLQAAEVLGHGDMQNPAKRQAQPGPNRPGIAHAAQGEQPQIEEPHASRKMTPAPGRSAWGRCWRWPKRIPSRAKAEAGAGASAIFRAMVSSGWRTAPPRTPGSSADNPISPATCTDEPPKIASQSGG